MKRDKNVKRPPLEDEPDFQRFCEDLESLKGRLPLHQPNDYLVNRILRQIPTQRRTGIPVPWKFLRWVTPTVVAGAMASWWFLFAAPFARFGVVRKMPLTFVFQDPKAGSVQLVGDFNRWNIKASPMKRENGKWVATLNLAPGRYQYEYLVDNHVWVSNTRPVATVTDGYGGTNAVVEAAAPVSRHRGSRASPEPAIASGAAQGSTLLASYPDIAQQARTRELPESLLEWRIMEGQSKRIPPEKLTSRLTSYMNDLQTGDRWLAEAGITHPANKAYALEVLTELMASGFSETDWRLLHAALPSPQSAGELVEAAQSVHLWQLAGCSPVRWEPLLKQASVLGRMGDVLLIAETAQEDRVNPQQQMAVLEDGLNANAETEIILSDMRKPNPASVPLDTKETARADDQAPASEPVAPHE